MIAMTKRNARASEGTVLEWRDGHALDPARFPEPLGVQAGAWVASVGEVEVAVRWREPNWGVLVSGAPVPYGFAPELRDAAALVEAAVRAYVARRRKAPAVLALEAVLRAEVERHGRAARVARAAAEALDAVGAVSDHLDDATAPRPSRFARALGIVLAEARRRGFAVTARGVVVETWRARARGRWMDEDEVVTGRGEGSSLVRIERGHVLEVYPADALDDARVDAERAEWSVRLDGSLVASIVGRSAALVYAVERARSGGVR